MIIEIIVKSEIEAVQAQEFGANRIELISALGEGGLTPSYGAIVRVVENVKIPVQVMIRPHSNSYTYSEEDFNIIKEDILISKELGANGIVFGCLKEDFTIDEKMLEAVLKLADGMDVTFHRAFDRVNNQQEAYKTLCKYKSNIKRVLTSGGKQIATDALENLKNLVELSRIENGPIIMPGSGVTPDNVEKLALVTNAKEFHYGLVFRNKFSPFSLKVIQKLDKNNLDKYY